MQNIFVKRLFLILFTGICLFGAVVSLASVVRYAPYGVAAAQREDYERKVKHIKQRQAAARNGLTQVPKAVVDQAVHAFGMMDPLTMSSHSFVVRNEGTASLILTGGETTCKCTLVSGSQQVIEPGEKAEITLTWNSGRVREYYQQTARIRTNDPLNPEIDLKIEGKVREELATSADEIVFVDLHPDGEGNSQIDLYSQLFDDFDLAQIESTLDDLLWSVEPLAADELARYEARSGYRIAVRLPLRNVERFINGVLRVKIPRPQPVVPTDATSTERGADQPLPEPEMGEPADEDEILKEISIRGRMPNRLALYGPGLNAEAGLRWGTLRTGKKHQRKLILKTRGSRQPKVLKIGDVRPDFIRATIEPKEGNDHRYVLSIVIPADAPMKIFNRPGEFGRVEIESDLLPSGKLVLPMSGTLLNR